MISAWKYPYALLGIAFVLVGYALWPSQKIPVLIYHDISTSTYPAEAFTTEATLLERELRYLQDKGYTTLSFANAAVLSESKKLPNKPVILTFDDALRGHSELALPLLRKHGLHATFFINSDIVGDAVHMRWEDVQKISEAGMEIGGHGATHAHVLQLNDAGLRREVADDKKRIEQEIGRAISVFAYPFQERSDRTDAAVIESGYTLLRDTSSFKNTVMTNSFDAFLEAL